MPSHSVFLVCVLLARISNASHLHISFLRSSSEIPPYAGANPKPKPDRDPTHISDFTDPDTGLNPFLDLPEGRTEAFGRRVMEQDRPAPAYPGMNVDVIEGGADDRGPRPRMPPPAPRGKNGVDPMGKNDFQKTARKGLDYPGVTLDFDAFTEANPFTASEESPVTSRASTEDARPARRDDVKRGTSDDVEHVTSKPGNPLAATNATTVSALAAGAGVAALALVVAVCFWKRRTSASATQPQDAESAPTRNCNEDIDADFRK